MTSPISGIPPFLIRAYREAKFVVNDSKPLALFVGQSNLELSRLLIAQGVTTAAFITAPVPTTIPFGFKKNTLPLEIIDPFKTDHDGRSSKIVEKTDHFGEIVRGLFKEFLICLGLRHRFKPLRAENRRKRPQKVKNERNRYNNAY